MDEKRVNVLHSPFLANGFTFLQIAVVNVVADEFASILAHIGLIALRCKTLLDLLKVQRTAHRVAKIFAFLDLGVSGLIASLISYPEVTDIFADLL